MYKLTLKSIVLVTFITSILSDNRIVQSCVVCPSGLGDCSVLEGGPFDNYVVPLNSGQTCTNSNNIYSQLASYHFSCQSSCQKGCELTITLNGFGIIGSQCTGTAQGQLAIKKLNIAYSRSVGDNSLSSEYDWCSCGQLSKALVIGLVFGSIIALCCLGALCNCLYQRYEANKKEEVKQAF